MTQTLGNKKEKKWGNKLLKVFKKAKGFDRNSTEIPPIVREPILWLKERNALGEEGIFRIPGSATKIRELKSRYDKGKKVDLSQIQNVHTVAGLLKVFFRELPEPLLTFELYDAWIEAIKPDDLKTKLERIRKVVFTLPNGNRIILDTLISFLKEVSLHTSNCMNIRNLAIVFAPSLIRPKVERIEDILGNSSYVNTLVVLLIQYYNFIFLGKPLEGDQEPQDVSLTPTLIPIEKARSIRDVSKEDAPKSSPRSKKTEKKDKDVKKSKRVTVQDKPDGSDKTEDEFLAKLKYGTIKLANSLIEEQSILCELQDIDSLSPNEIEMIEKKLMSKVKETKVLRSRARKARMVQRSISSNFNRLRELNEQLSIKKEEDSLREKEKENDIQEQISKDEQGDNKEEINNNQENEDIINENIPNIEELNLSEITDLQEDYYKFEEELDGILDSDEEEEEEQINIEDVSSISTQEEEDERTTLELEDVSSNTIDESESNISPFESFGNINNIIDAVLDGNMGMFQNYLGKFKTMGRIDRSKSRKQLLEKINFVDEQE